MPDDHTPAIHDLGGLPRFHCTPVEHDEVPPDAFGKKVDALRQVLAQKKLRTEVIQLEDMLAQVSRLEVEKLS